MRSAATSSDARDSFDLVILNLPDVTGSAFNRYYTVEFYERIKAPRAPERRGRREHRRRRGCPRGRTGRSGGLDPQRRWRKVFSIRSSSPGEQTWLIASDAGHLTGDPAIARDRFAAMADSQRVFPAAGLLSVYLPDRAAEAMLAYDRVDLPERLLVNRDSHPLAHLYGLLLAARQSGASVTRFVRLLALGGWLPFVVPDPRLCRLAALAMAERRPGSGPSSFDSAFLVFSTGWVGIAMVILLMYLYETHFGSLYLHIGLISSLFMAGLTAGACSSAVHRSAVGRRPLHVLLVGVLLRTHSFWRPSLSALRVLGGR